MFEVFEGARASLLVGDEECAAPLALAAPPCQRGYSAFMGADEGYLGSRRERPDVTGRVGYALAAFHPPNGSDAALANPTLARR